MTSTDRLLARAVRLTQQMRDLEARRDRLADERVEVWNELIDANVSIKSIARACGIGDAAIHTARKIRAKRAG